MFLPRRLLTLELKRHNCWKQYLKYEDHLIKKVNNKLRIEFLQNCKRADIIPRFLKFRIPTNGCFDEKSIGDFQRQLLHKELIRAKEDLNTLNAHLSIKRTAIIGVIPRPCLPSVILHTRITPSK